MGLFGQFFLHPSWQPASSDSLECSGFGGPGDFADAFKVPGMLTDIWLADPKKIQKLVMPQVTPYTSWVASEGSVG